MKAVLIPVGEAPRIIEADGLHDLQRAVGGRIEACGWVFGDRPALYVNEEGKLACAPNRAIYATALDEGKTTWGGKVIREGDVLDILFGDVVAVGFDPETGEDRDVTDEEVARVMERFGAGTIGSGLREVLRLRAGI